MRFSNFKLSFWTNASGKNLNSCLHLSEDPLPPDKQRRAVTVRRLMSVGRGVGGVGGMADGWAILFSGLVWGKVQNLKYRIKSKFCMGSFCIESILL